MSQSKRCLGIFHPPGGELVPLSEYTFNKSGPRKGKPLSRCRRCRSLGNSKTVPVESFLPIVERLIEAGIITPELSALSEGNKKRIYAKTFLSLKRLEQELNNSTKIEKYKPKSKKDNNRITKLSYEERIGLKRLVAARKKELYLIDKKLLKY